MAENEPWTRVELGEQDYKRISELWLLNHFSPSTIRHMNNGIRKMRPVVARAIKDYVSTAVDHELTYEKLIAKATANLKRAMKEEGWKFAESEMLAHAEEESSLATAQTAECQP